MALLILELIFIPLQKCDLPHYFISYVVAHYQTESSTLVAPNHPNQSSQVSNDTSEIPFASRVETPYNSSATEATATSVNSIPGHTSSATSAIVDPSTDMATDIIPNDLIHTKPSNLLVTFLEYCSIVMQVGNYSVCLHKLLTF